MRRERNALNWLAAEYLGADPNCTITAPEHVCKRRDGRLVRDGQEDCHASASKEVETVCALCQNRGEERKWSWNQNVYPWRGTLAHKGCIDDFERDRLEDYNS